MFGRLPGNGTRPKGPDADVDEGGEGEAESEVSLVVFIVSVVLDDGDDHGMDEEGDGEDSEGGGNVVSEERHLLHFYEVIVNIETAQHQHVQDVGEDGQDAQTPGLDEQTQVLQHEHQGVEYETEDADPLEGELVVDDVSLGGQEAVAHSAGDQAAQVVEQVGRQEEVHQTGHVEQQDGREDEGKVVGTAQDSEHRVGHVDFVGTEVA